MKKTIRDFELKNKKVIIRCDFNVPMKAGVIQDDTRIVASLETIRYAIQNQAKVILLSHLGKVKSVEDQKQNNLYPVSVRLEELLGQKVFFSNTTRGTELEELVSNLQAGEVLLVQNTRYEDLEGKKESSCDLELSQYWASLGDIFINDAYGTCHRKHASNVGIGQILPSGIGFLVERETCRLDEIMNENTHPFIVIMGGAKVHDKIKVIENLIEKCDKILIGGGMAYTFLKASGFEIGSSILDEESLDFCQKMLKDYANKIVLPIDHVVSSSITDSHTQIRRNGNILEKELGLDIGPETVTLFKKELANAKRVVVNGPMGCFEQENYAKGTKEIYDFLTKNNIKTLVGGGDSASSVKKLSNFQAFYHISTGGGATLEYLEGTELPGISVIDEKEKI